MGVNVASLVVQCLESLLHLQVLCCLPHVIGLLLIIDGQRGRVGELHQLAEGGVTHTCPNGSHQDQLR